MTLLLKDEEWGKRSDRWIADKCGVSPDTVNRHRAQLCDSDSSRTERTGQDGKTRRLPERKPPTVDEAAADFDSDDEPESESRHPVEHQATARE